MEFFNKHFDSNVTVISRRKRESSLVRPLINQNIKKCHNDNCLFKLKKNITHQNKNKNEKLNTKNITSACIECHVFYECLRIKKNFFSSVIPAVCEI